MSTQTMKRVQFNDAHNKTYETYSHNEYDRYPIDSVLYQYGYRRISQQEWEDIFVELNHYKCTEMVVHKNSTHMIRLHTKDTEKAQEEAPQ